jgi:sorting nexin-25
LKVFLSQSRVNLSGTAGKPSAPSRSASTNVADDTVIGSPNLVKNLYHQVTSSLDDIFLKPSMIDVMAEKLNRQAVDMAEAWDASVTQIGNYGLELGNSVLSPYALRALRTPASDTHSGEKEAFPFPAVGEQPMGQSPEYKPSAQPQAIVEETVFTTPITDFLVEIFGLKNGDWLRKQALVIVMQQLLGSTIER